jgi:WD40 repeat protein
LWKWDQYGQLDKIDSVMGHKNRVLYLAGESQGGKIVTGAGDQELRLWKIFDES